MRATYAHRMRQPNKMKTESYLYGVEKLNGYDAWELMKASAGGDKETVQRLLKKDARLVNAQYWYQHPIHFAVREGHADLVKTLLDAGAEPGRSRYMYRSWQTLLEEAERRKYGNIRELLEAEMKRRYGYDRDFEPLAAAVRERDQSAVEQLLKQTPRLLHAADVFGNNLLHWAAHTVQTELLDLFIQSGVDMNARRADGQTPAMIAMNGDYWHRRWKLLPKYASNDEQKIIERLLERGAKYELNAAVHMKDAARVKEIMKENPSLAGKLDSSHRSPLFYAARARQTDVAETLLNAGADPSAPETLAPRGRALHEAASQSRVKLTRLLLEFGADPNADVDSSGNPLFISRNNNPDGSAGKQTRELLIQFGARKASYEMSSEELKQALLSDDPPLDDEQFVSSVFEKGGEETIRTLIEKHPEALHTLPIVGARYPTSAKNLRALLDAGADPNASDWLGKTALHFAAEKGDLEAAQLLIERGADINAVEAEYRSTPLAEAAGSGQIGMARLLLENGADPHIPDDAWARPIAWAKRSEHADMEALLMERAPPL